MKHFNFLSNLLSLSLGSPCTDVSLDRRLTVGSPSGRYCSGLMQLVFILAILLTVGVGNVWGTETSHTCSGTSGTIVTSKITWAATSATWSSPQCRIAADGTVVFTLTGVNVTKIIMGFSSSSYIGDWSSSGGGSFSSNNSTVTWTGSAGAGTLTFTTSAAARLKTIKVTHTDAASCTVTPTVGSSLTSVSATVNSITATVPISAIGGCNITENGLVYSTSVATPTVGAANCTKVTTTACGSTAVNKTVTISDLPCGTSYYVRGYATNAAGTSYTNVTTQSTSACPTYTVTYNAGTGTCGTAQWTQPSYEASTTLPSATAPATCTGYSFAGWCTSSAGSADENTTSPGTILLSGSSYTPTGDITLYAVYTKTVGGGGSSWVETDFADLTSSDVFVLATPAGYALPSNGGNAKPVVSAITVSAGKITSTVTDGLKWNMSGNSTDGYTFYPNGTTSTWLCCTTTASSGTNDNIRINNSGSRKVWITDSDGDLKTKDTYTDRWLCCYNSADFRGYTASNVTSDIISKCYKYSSGTTYYMTSLVCCTELASINGSVNWSNPTTAVVTWNKLADQVTSWALSWSPNTAGSSITSAIADAGGGTQKTATVSGLACGTEYTFTVTPTVKSGVCTPASNPTIVSTSTKYSITRSGSPAGTVTGGTFTTKISGSAVTEACNGSTIQIAATPATGYEFTSWSINSGAVSPAASTASTTFTMPSDNVTVTAAFSCVTPTWSTNLTEETVNYLTGGSATALTVGASANGATINYQWQTKVGDGAWTNSGTNAPGNTSITPSTAGPGTTSYRCIATNAASGCSATATSNVVTVVVTNPSGYCISAFNSSNNGITGGFSNGGSGNHYTLSYTIPGKSGGNWPQFWIGENESFQSSFSVNANFADMPLMSNNSATLGLAEGATGTLHIWNDNIQANSNLYVKFEPSGYGLRWGGAGEWNQAANTKAFTVDPGDANVYWTDIVTLDGTNNTTWNYYVGLQTASGYVYSGVDNEASDSRGISRTRSVTAMKVSNGTNGSFKATYLNSEPTNSRGKFRIWNNNITDYNFVCHWVPFYRVTYNGNGASGSVAASADVCCEGNAAARTVKAAANGFTAATGKQFAGWATSAGGAKVYDPNDDIVLTADVVLYPVWEDIDYTVTVNQSPSIGATTTGQTSTAHYNGTINLTTTVPAGYRFVNWTTTDGFSITNNTSATTASFTMPNKSVTVTANFQQTHSISWYVGGTGEGNKLTTGSQTTVVDHGGSITTLPSEPSGTACDKTFVGWTNTSSYSHGTSPLYTHNTASFPAINKDESFYAVFAEGSAAYNLVESDPGATNWAGDYLIAYSSTVFADGHLGGTGSSDAGKGIGAQNSSVDPDDNLSANGKVVDATWGDTHNVTLELVTGSTNTYVLKTKDGKYNYQSSNNNGLAATETKSTAEAYPISVTFTSSSDVKLGLGGGAAGAVFRYNTNGYFRYYKNGGQNAVYLYKKSAVYTGHTLTCADCGTSVTPTYTASPTGGTVSVTKSASPVTSGSTVKTCTAVDLTVTITPATHYTLTGFTATGLTTGTATISPAVNTVVPTTSAQTFTVTVSAGATGTLNLTPTFTAETPLTITLDTHSKGTFTPIGTIYSGDSFTFPEVTPNDAECADFVGWVEGTSIAEEGTSTEPTTIAAGSSSGTLTTNKTYTAVYAEKDKTESDAYVKVTSSISNWSGTYLIVHDGSSRALDGSLTSDLGSTGDYFSVSITDGAIAATSTLATKNWTIAKIGETSTYTIKSASGYYIGRATASNGLDKTTTAGDADANSITYSSGVSIAGSASTAKLQYWVSGANACFKYYTSSQNAVSLYKLGTAEVVTYTYTVNPACTAKYRVTVNSATGGSPNADPKYLPEGETVTLTANPAAGYTFTSWTITKTTGGDNVTSTLLTGDKPTTANTSFAMPAYDVTVTATYAKIYVTSVVAKDGETVLNTTDSKLNVHTGANKTVTVEVTPADAFDHSWSAEVTSGGTYASISNVTSEGFRVNGLAEGDATIVVTAPNDDGTDRTATFTVHVTDIVPEEIILKRDGSNTPIETLIMYYDASESKGQYVKVNVGYSPSNPTNKNFTFSSAATGKVGSHSHSNNNGYEVLVANGVTTDPVNCTFTSSADGSVTKVLAVTVLPILTDRFVDYVHGNATQTVSARLSVDRFSIITDINTPSLSDASDADPTSKDCETAHYHLIGWLPQATAEALMAAGTPITEATEGLVRAGAEVEATGQTWCAIWAEEAE